MRCFLPILKISYTLRETLAFARRNDISAPLRPSGVPSFRFRCKSYSAVYTCLIKSECYKTTAVQDPVPSPPSAYMHAYTPQIPRLRLTMLFISFCCRAGLGLETPPNVRA